MQSHEHTSSAARVEVVTTTFVASGAPEGIHDLGRLLETLNSPGIGRQLELREPVVRPLYRAGSQLALDAPLLVRREDIVFANFEGPFFNSGAAPRAVTEAPVLLLAPPFQIQGAIEAPAGADATQALRGMAQQFFVVRRADVFDTEGAMLGEGEQIVVNGAVVQMMSVTKHHVEAAATHPAARRKTKAKASQEPAAAEESATRAA